MENSPESSWQLHKIFSVKAMMGDLLRGFDPRRREREKALQLEGKLKSICLDILIQDNGLCIKQYGNTLEMGGDDYDLWFVYDAVDKIPTEVRQKEIVKELAKTGAKVHPFFVTKKAVEEGILEPSLDVLPIEHHMRRGIPASTNKLNFTKGDLAATYILASMHDFVVRSDAEKVDHEMGRDAINLTHRGAADWNHYYTACFLDLFLNRRGVEKAKYADRLSKTLIRVFLGNYISRLSEEELPQAKTELISAIQQQSRQDMDERLISFLLKAEEERLLPEDVKLLRQAIEIRSGKSKVNKNYVSRAERRLFYNTFQTGIELRREIEGAVAVDALSDLAFQIILEEKRKDLEIKSVQFNDGEVFIDKKINPHGKSLFYFPQYRINQATGIAEENGGFRIDTEDKIIHRKAGHITGELAAFLGVVRTANVIAEGYLEGYCLDGEKLMDQLGDSNLQKRLRAENISAKDQFFDIMLRYLAYETIFLMNEMQIKEPIGVENEAVLRQHNKLEAYYASGSVMIDFFKRLKDVRYQINDRQFIEEITYDRGKDNILFNKGADPDGYIYFVSQGQVEISDIAGSKKNVIVKEGSFVGESSLIYFPRSATARLTEDAIVYRIPVDLFNQFVHSREPVAGTDFLPVQVLYHLAAANLGRLRSRVERSGGI